MSNESSYHRYYVAGVSFATTSKEKATQLTEDLGTAGRQRRSTTSERIKAARHRLAALVRASRDAGEEVTVRAVSSTLWPLHPPIDVDVYPDDQPVWAAEAPVTKKPKSSSKKASSSKASSAKQSSTKTSSAKTSSAKDANATGNKAKKAKVSANVTATEKARVSTPVPQDTTKDLAGAPKERGRTADGAKKKRAAPISRSTAKV